MKKTIISFSILFFASFTVFGQSVTLNPTVNGGLSQISAHGLLQNPVLFGYKTRGTSASPTSVGSGDKLLWLAAEGFAGGTPRFNASITFNAAQDFTPTATGTSISFFTTANSTFAPIERMIIGNNGNVGIGTLSPNGNLSFGNTNNNRKILLYEDANNDHQFMGFGVNSQMLRYQIPSTTNNHVFYAGTSSTTSSELMRITGTGRVGIGTTNPQSILEVSTPTESYGVQHTDGTVTLGTYVSTTFGGYLGTRSNHPLRFFVNSGSTKLQIETGGNVVVTDFTKLGGASAPAIKQKLITGFVTLPTEGSTTSIPHGLTPAKILEVSIFVEATNGFTSLLNQVPPNYKGTAEMEYSYVVEPSNVEVTLSNTNSGSLLVKPIRILITYMQ